MLSTSFIIVILLAIVLGMGVAIYNRLTRLRNAIANGFAQIDVQLKRRYDLIPNLIETARKYLQHERETLEAVINARNQAQSAAGKVRARSRRCGPRRCLGCSRGGARWCTGPVDGGGRVLS